MRNVLITGASSGIGRACALDMASRGWRVFAGVRRDEDGDALQAEASSPDRLVPLRLDVTNAEDLRGAVDHIGATGGALHGLVNNAGFVVAGPLECLTADELRHQLEVNVIGVAEVTRACLPLLRAADPKGRIVLMSSISGKVALPFAAPYAMSKFALEAYGDALRRELRPQSLAVTIVEPGSIRTPIWERTLQRTVPWFDQADEVQKARYGQAMNGIRRRAEARATQGAGAPVSLVTRAVRRALEARRPPTRILVGRDARILSAARALLPDRWLDALIARMLERAARRPS